MGNEFLLPKDFINSSGARDRKWPRDESLAYTRWLARIHYENFHVVTFLLPKRLRQDFYNVYGFCRWADDLADEIGDNAESLRLLQWWRGELGGLYAGHATHPVFVALRDTVAKHDLPQQPFADLIHAFEQDQTVARYRSMDDLLDYCRYSANPVGRLVLALCGHTDDHRHQLSDATCTGLQLANFWQDVTVDWKKDRVYIPEEILQRHGSSIDDIRLRNAGPEFRAAMREVVDEAQGFFERGLPLAGIVGRRLAVDLELFSRGGMRVLEKIRRQNYDVLRERPSISRVERASLLLETLARITLRRAA